MSFDVKYFQNETLSGVSQVEENLIAVAYFFVKYHPLNKQFSNFIVFLVKLRGPVVLKDSSRKYHPERFI